MTTRVKWQCPQCERKFTIPAGKQIELCPDCERETLEYGEPDDTPPIPQRQPPARPTQSLPPDWALAAGHLRTIAGIYGLTAVLIGLAGFIGCAIAFDREMPWVGGMLVVATPLAVLNLVTISAALGWFVRIGLYLRTIAERDNE